MLERSYRVVTLGCKLNQFDSASIEGKLRARGFARAADHESAGVVVINTCTVTENADREARRLARRARRENPGCRLLVTGCYAELDRARLSAMEEIDAVVGHADRDRLPALLDALAREAAPAPREPGSPGAGTPPPTIASSGLCDPPSSAYLSPTAARSAFPRTRAPEDSGGHGGVAAWVLPSGEGGLRDFVAPLGARAEIACIDAAERGPSADVVASAFTRAAGRSLDTAGSPFAHAGGRSFDPSGSPSAHAATHSFVAAQSPSTDVAARLFDPAGGLFEHADAHSFVAAGGPSADAAARSSDPPGFPSARVQENPSHEGDLADLWFGERTRAFLKIQEGCALACSYCIIPRVRGASRSVPPERVASALSALVARGYREIVLTGVNTGDYGKDLVPRTELASLLDRLLRICSAAQSEAAAAADPGDPVRLRLNSLEPRTVSAEIMALLREDPRICRHLQMPLQSGCDRTLTRMHRNYRVSDYGRVAETLRREVPDVGLGADVIAGFPGETESEFEETCRFIASSPLNYLHVFSYSDRPGTTASSMDAHVPPEAIRERSARLRALGAALSLGFRQSFVGRTLPVLILREPGADGGIRALSDNFIEMGVRAAGCTPNRIVSARVVSAGPQGTLGEIATAS